MSWTEALAMERLSEGDKQVVTLNGLELLLVRHEGKVYATDSRCPHMRGRLVRGTVRDGAIVCPLHHSAFDLATGDVIAWAPWPPGVGRVLGAVRRERSLTVYKTREEDGMILIDLPE